MLLEDRLRGSLYGLLIGDALGCPVEGMSPEAIAQSYGVLDELKETTRRYRPAGLHSDDGQQALALLDALLLTPDAPEVELARLFVELYHGGPESPGVFGSHRGTGNNFRRTVKALLGGQGPHSGAQPSAGNGVAMMIAPAAWYFRDDPERLLDAVVRVARVKQRDLRGIAAGGAVAYAVAYALPRTSFAELPAGDFVRFVEAVERRAAEALGTKDELGTFSAALERMLAGLSLPRAEALSRIKAFARETAGGGDYGMGYAPDSVVTAIYMALTAASFEAAARDTVNLGGDADSNGAIAGAIAGALYGAGALPRRWYEGLVARGCFDDRIAPLIARRPGFRPATPLAAKEREWTELLKRRPAPS